LLLLASSAFVHNISMQMGIIGPMMPSSIVGLSLAGIAIGLLLPQELNTASPAYKPN
jgi:hypothetical protein